MKMNKRQLVVLAAAALLACGSVFAQAKKEVTFAHQDMLVPFRTVMESGELEKATGYKINWRMFGGGGDVIRAMASGDVQLGEAGSPPDRRGGVSQGQDIQLFWILDDIADAEALVARNGSGINRSRTSRARRSPCPSCRPRITTCCPRCSGTARPQDASTSSTCARPRSPPPGSAATSTPPSSGIRCWPRSRATAR